jgi:hypothetical protein
MEQLFYLENKVDGKNLNLFFHKDYTYNYNPETYPVVKYTLVNCQNVNNHQFSSFADDNDGISIAVKSENGVSKLILTNVSDTSISIHCESIIKEDIKYREEDFVHLINEILKQRNEALDSNSKSIDLLFELKYFMEQEVIKLDRKKSEAQWLQDEKRQFLEGQKNILLRILEFIDTK